MSGVTGGAGMDQGEFRTVLGHFASGLVLVTGLHEGQPAGLTCQSFFSLSLDPPLVAMAPGKSSTSWPKVSSSGSICVNILSEEQEAMARTFAKTGADKFSGVGWSPAANGAPRLQGSLAWLECTIEDVHEAGDHWLVTARVIDLEATHGKPLVFYRGGFGGFTA
ncbi:MAG: flavin reductase family protein [Actinomycetota bacterium]|nr:flavin reductase family protein [Actinomycetota bacterium]